MPSTPPTVYLTPTPYTTITAVLILALQVLLQPADAVYSFGLSNSCQPSCRRSQTCIKQTRNCTEPSSCPSIIYCVNVRHLPLRYRDSVQALLATPTPQPGCPVRQTYSPCLSQCQDNSDCQTGHLCCFNGCGHVCIPDLRQPYRRKAGFCPKRSWNVNPTCQSNCQNDYECRGHRKCCRTPCGNMCTHPCFFMLSDNGRWRLPPGCRTPE